MDVHKICGKGEPMGAFRRLSKSAGEGVKQTIAVALITLGVQLIEGGDLIAGGALVTIGWILFTVNHYILGR